MKKFYLTTIMMAVAVTAMLPQFAQAQTIMKSAFSDISPFGKHYFNQKTNSYRYTKETSNDDHTQINVTIYSGDLQSIWK